MNRLLLLLCFATSVLYGQDCSDVNWENISDPGPYNIDRIQEMDGLRDGPDYDGASIYYPTNASGELPAIVIVPGFLSQPSTVIDWGPFYASHGIIAMIIGTNALSELPEDRAFALIDALETLRQENTRQSSPLEGKIDTSSMAVSGWSMGGGGAQRAAVLDNSIKAVIALCPWLTQPELDHEAPVLIFGGQLDAVAPPNAHADEHYLLTPATTEKLQFTVRNGGHQVANNPEGGNGDVGKMAISWLKYYLSDDSCYCPLLLEEPESAFRYETNVVCGNVTSTHTIPTPATYTIYPNPASTSFTISTESDDALTYELYTALGQRLSSGTLRSSKQEIDVSTLPANLYFLKIGQEVIKVQIY